MLFVSSWNGFYLLQNASHIPFALTGLKFFASLTSTCNEPFDDELRELVDDFMLPNLRKPLLIDDLEKCDDFESGGTNFKPTIMSPRYVVEMSSNGSLYGKSQRKSTKKEKQKKKKTTTQTKGSHFHFHSHSIYIYMYLVQKTKCWGGNDHLNIHNRCRNALSHGKLLTRSWSVYHCGCGLSNTMPCKLMVTSPRKSLRPNISECQTVNHSVLVSKLFNGMKYLSVSSNTGFSVCFLTLVLRLPFFDLSGSKYTYTR